MRQEIIIKAANLQHRSVQIERWLGIRRVEGAGLGGMLVLAQSDMKSSLDLAHRSIDIQQQAIAMTSSDFQAVRLCELDHCFIVLFRRPEVLGELLWGQITAIIGAGVFADLGEQIGQSFAVAQRQADSKV